MILIYPAVSVGINCPYYHGSVSIDASSSIGTELLAVNFGEAEEPDFVLDRTTPVALQIPAHLRLMIIRLHFKPGEAISETEAALNFGVSRTPIKGGFHQARRWRIAQHLSPAGDVRRARSRDGN